MVLNVTNLKANFYYNIRPTLHITLFYTLPHVPKLPHRKIALVAHKSQSEYSFQDTRETKHRLAAIGI